MKELNLNKTNLGKGNLALVNRDHPLVAVNTNLHNSLVRLNNTNILIHYQAGKMLNAIFRDINSNNRIVPVSGYRSSSEQKKIYDDSINENGTEFTSKYVALPNCSEHETGLAIDLSENTENIDFICPNFPHMGICHEFRKKSMDYGFIERYQKDKESITGISHEPWHFRYVGYPHSKIICENNFSLEEYINYLKNFPYGKNHLYINHSKYLIEIFYVEIKSQEHLPVKLQSSMSHSISGNNEDGFIITNWRNIN